MKTLPQFFLLCVLSTLCAGNLYAQGRVIATIPEARRSNGTIETPAQRAQRAAQNNVREQMIARQRAQAQTRQPSSTAPTYTPPTFVPPSTYRPQQPTVNVQPRYPTFTPKTNTPQVDADSVMRRNEQVAEELRQQAEQRRAQSRAPAVPAPRSYPWTQPSTTTTTTPSTTPRYNPPTPPSSPWGNTLSQTAAVGQVRPLTGNSSPIRIIKQVAISEKVGSYGLRVVNASNQRVQVRVWTDMSSYAARPSYGDHLVEFAPNQVLADPWSAISRAQLSSYVFQVIEN